MNIFQVIESSANPSLSNNRTWFRNFYEPLIEMGHDVVLFPAEEGRQAMQRNDLRLRTSFSERLLSNFRNEQKKRPFDLFFAYLMDGMIEPSVIDEIRKTGVPTSNFSCNNTHQFYLISQISTHFDYNLHSEKSASGKFRAIGANHLWWPMASNPRYFRPINVPRFYQVSFVGMNYALRSRYIADLLENGVEVHAFGPGWQGGARTHWRSIAKHYLFLLRSFLALDPIEQSTSSTLLADHDFRRGLYARFPQHLHLPITDDHLISLYSSSHISLGFLEVYDNHNPSSQIKKHVHLREFEAPMSGALYCTGYMDELAEMFDPDKEIIVYRNFEELLTKVQYYLSHPSEAETIRKAGRMRALSHHTYQNRYKQLFEQIGLRGN